MSLAFFADFAQRPPMQPVLQEPPKDTKPPADTKPAADPKPPEDEQQQGGLPKEIATGEQPTFEVSPEGGEGLSQMAQQIHSGLSPEMKQLNSYDSIYNNLVDNAVQRNGFQRGTDNSVLPQQFQGNQTSGRDLDLIYASDKFKVDLKPDPKMLNTYVAPGRTLEKGGDPVVTKDGNARMLLDKDGRLQVQKKEGNDWKNTYVGQSSDGREKGDKAVFTEDGKIVMKNDRGEDTGWSIDAKKAWETALPPEVHPVATVKLTQGGDPVESPDKQTRVMLDAGGKPHIQQSTPAMGWQDVYVAKTPVPTDGGQAALQVAFNSDGSISLTGSDNKTFTFNPNGKLLTGG
jgi:hypothetical protein